MEVKFVKMRDNAKLPQQAHKNDAGYDVSWAPENGNEYSGGWFRGNQLQEMKVIKPGESVLLKTGLRALFPSGFVMEIKNRSGMAAKKGLLVGACIVDSGYRGEIFVNLHNVSSEEQVVQPGDRIAQCIFYSVENVVSTEITREEYDEYETSRKDGALGSSGK